MMPYGNGMVHSVEEHLRAPGDCYITEGWMLAHWIRVTQYTAPPNLLIWDPAACGVEGWAIGRALGLALGRPYLLSDLRPMGEGMPSTGKSHCIGLWVEPVSWKAAHDEISVDVTPADLRWGVDLMRWCKEAAA